MESIHRQPRLRLYFSGIGQLLEEVHSKHVYPGKSTQQCAKSTQDLKNTSVLTHYNLKLEVHLAVDASPFGLGTVISLKKGRSIQSLMPPAEKNTTL